MVMKPQAGSPADLSPLLPNTSRLYRAEKRQHGATVKGRVKTVVTTKDLLWGHKEIQPQAQ